MQIAIISWSGDPAGKNIHESLLMLFKFKQIGEFDNNPLYELSEDSSVKLFSIDTDPLYAEEIMNKIECDAMIFASKHSAPSGIKTLSCHPIGNFGKAEKGGLDKKLCVALPNFLKTALVELNKYGSEIEHEVTMEATHHGPFVEKPIMFIEIGSNADNWSNKVAGDAIAKAIISVVNDKKEYENCFLIGGGHYNHVGNKVMLKSDYSCGHIATKYACEGLDEEMILQALDKSKPKSSFVLLDWKGIGKEKPRIIEILNKNKIRIERSDKFFK